LCRNKIMFFFILLTFSLDLFVLSLRFFHISLLLLACFLLPILLPLFLFIFIRSLPMLNLFFSLCFYLPLIIYSFFVTLIFPLVFSFLNSSPSLPSFLSFRFHILILWTYRHIPVSWLAIHFIEWLATSFLDAVACLFLNYECVRKERGGRKRDEKNSLQIESTWKKNRRKGYDRMINRPIEVSGCK
jgi:hypothetical protein